ncbi:MAG: hypothetical protein PHN56_01525 [Candidatus Nanoarchaeia archaeon]|nr:hypothetical protein [Candidatus Nanoarchaeia archaeon]
MITEFGLGLICIGWIVQIIKMKKDELNKYTLLLYILGVVILSYSGMSDGIIASADWLNVVSAITSGVVLYKVLKLKKK